MLSTIRYFRHEYEAHIREKRCPAVVCGSLFKAPCMHACPVGMDIPAYISLIKANRLDDAYRVLLRTNPFPSICGRVCDHKCEAKCRRSTLDEPLSIKNLKRFITDHAKRPPVERAAVSKKERIAVIGAGPSGLTAARDLALMGYPVTVFESLPEPGGMLRWGIPEYRLPRHVLRREIQDILDLGVELKLDTKLGREISWEGLRKDFDAIYLAIGAQRSPGADLEGGNLKGVYGAVEFLRDLNLGKSVSVGERVAVIGGGNSAVDASRSALRLGAKKVTLVYRRRKEDMPAQEEEILAAEQEGIEMKFLSAPLRVEGAGGKVERIVCREMELGDFDAGGRRRPIPKEGHDFSLDVDEVILAIGQEVDFPSEFAPAGITLSKSGLIDIKKETRTETGAAMVFAGGDAVTGPDTVVGAIAAGRRAALEIDRSVCRRNGALSSVSGTEEISIPMTVEEEIHEAPRARMSEAGHRERIRDFREVELGLSTGDALKEAQRCLRCDVQAS
ncbi:MAG: hypothetical protein C4576_15515 [Desulfobacteraceae bacterium]|nr:MAG: hypothetical protein C4576_15515 [Desulfobacteraceae bacterium]